MKVTILPIIIGEFGILPKRIYKRFLQKSDDRNSVDNRQLLTAI